MRLLLIFFSVGCLASSGAGAAAELPYVVQTQAGGAELRSGPGREYYVTQRLAGAVDVEVYRREADGWLAVRPPRGSFSWVRASDLRATEDPQIAQVSGLRAVSWIGTDLEEVGNHKWQVRLKPDEQVEILGHGSLEVFQGAGTEQFARISPPAGEFRWIHESATRRHAATTAGQHSEIRPAGFESDAEDSSRGSLARSARLSQTSDSAAGAAELAPDVPSAVTESDLQSPQQLSSSVARRILQVDLDLALALTKPPHEWDLAAVRQRIGELSASAPSTVQRARARRVQQKLEAFELLRIRYLGLGPAGLEEPERIAATGAELDQVVAADFEVSADPAVRFDGSGWLLPVHTKKRASPPYALLDDDGQILQFVSPAPGLNLHRYLRHQVGIIGQRRTSGFLDKPHLTAHRVIDLARHNR